MRRMIPSRPSRALQGSTAGSNPAALAFPLLWVFPLSWGQLSKSSGEPSCDQVGIGEDVSPLVLRHGLGSAVAPVALRTTERHSRRLDGSERLGKLIQGVRFRDGEPVQATEESAA